MPRGIYNRKKMKKTTKITKQDNSNEKEKEAERILDYTHGYIRARIEGISQKTGLPEQYLAARLAKLLQSR